MGWLWLSGSDCEQTAKPFERWDTQNVFPGCAEGEGLNLRACILLMMYTFGLLIVSFLLYLLAAAGAPGKPSLTLKEETAVSLKNG